MSQYTELEELKAVLTTQELLALESADMCCSATYKRARSKTLVKAFSDVLQPPIGELECKILKVDLKRQGKNI